VFSFPLLAWSRTVLQPMLLLLLGSATGRTTVLFLHEWSDLHPLRRAIYLPFVALCRTIIMLSPTVEAGFRSDPVVRWARSKCRLALHAPVLRPATRESSPRVAQVEKFASGCDLVIGYFGSIYRKKEPTVLLEVCRHLRRNQVRASVLFVGGFTNSIDGYESRFLQTVRAMGLEDAVFVTGYVERAPELFALLECADVFIYLFPEGLTTRRSSVLTSVEAGRPVLVPDPACAAEVSHHPGYCALIRDGAVQLIPRDASLPQIADAVVAAARRRPIAQPVDFEAGGSLRLLPSAARSAPAPTALAVCVSRARRQIRRVPSGQAPPGPREPDKESIEPDIKTEGAICLTAQTACLWRTAGRP
jgi:glycosyltransferase involved in cell wall biosynthesis